jgi:hypothetical protein
MARQSGRQNGCFVANDDEPAAAASNRTIAALPLIGWALTLAGAGLWTFGYIRGGAPSFFDWPALAPWWIADYLPNALSEIGMLLMLVAIVPMYWPRRRT